MAERGLFERALGLERPWRVKETEFDAAERRLDLQLDFEPGGTFDCPSCGRGGPTLGQTPVGGIACGR